MKDRGVLHPRLAAVVASMGHGDLLGVADAGLPIPLHVERVDLAFAPGRPGFVEVVDTIAQELRVEAYVVAAEAVDASPAVVAALRERFPQAEEQVVSHEELKRRSAGARAVVRTGEFTPYANVLLRSGVDFDAARGGVVDVGVAVGAASGTGDIRDPG